MSKQTYLKTINFPEYSKLLAAAKENKERINSLVINNDSDKKMFKEERAKTNKFIKEFKANAKAVREKVLGEFDPKVKELSSVLEETQLLCKDKIEDYDLTWKHERENWVLAAINLRITDDISEFVDVDTLDDSRYLNASMTEKKIAEDLDNKVSKIKSDLQVAQAISPQVAAIFKECLDIPEAIARDKRQQEEQAKREAIAKAAAEREEAERKKALEREKELARQAMIKSELEEAKENGEVIDAQKMVEINAKADTYAEKEEIKVATFTVTFEYKDSDYPLAWENPIDDIKERLQGLSNVKVLGE
ncbi:hypothetical protein NH458_00615 [Lactococcus garvieae]|uniref:hypothetical protein n=1 Tax=Lactococcus garvieae TaxID=1363 RepID=UPI0020971B4E|nr:hypothetical protein [Lactococcus garvieae]MCO7128566.1 hypothetical protein [Lactococcus garvieae]